jgi:cytidylate kinase
VKLIGLSGTNGSGKDTAGEIVAEKYGYLFVSVSDLLRVELRARGIPVERQHLRKLSAEWRREFGLGVLVDKAVELAEKSGYPGVVASPMRNVGEAQHLKDLGGTLVWVDADQAMRYQRVRSTHRGRPGEDDKTFEQFCAEEQAEMYPSDPNDPAVLNMAGVRALADITIVNESDLQALQASVGAALGL